MKQPIRMDEMISQLICDFGIAPSEVMNMTPGQYRMLVGYKNSRQS